MLLIALMYLMPKGAIGVFDFIGVSSSGRQAAKNGADKWGDYQRFPWTMGFQPSYRTEAQIYAKYILKEKPNPKIAILYQNDDFGKDYVAGMKDVLGDKFDKLVVTASYEATDPTIDSDGTHWVALGNLIAGAGAPLDHSSPP